MSIDITTGDGPKTELKFKTPEELKEKLRALHIQ